jgi:hypothetical protein
MSADAPQELHGNEALQYAKAHLRQVHKDLEKWQIQYVDPATNDVWLLDYPHSEYHGGGSPRLRKMSASAKT